MVQVALQEESKGVLSARKHTVDGKWFAIKAERHGNMTQMYINGVPVRAEVYKDGGWWVRYGCGEVIARMGPVTRRQDAEEAACGCVVSRMTQAYREIAAQWKAAEWKPVKGGEEKRCGAMRVRKEAMQKGSAVIGYRVRIPGMREPLVVEAGNIGRKRIDRAVYWQYMYNSVGRLDQGEGWPEEEG